jgi:hypothetical protein
MPKWAIHGCDRGMCDKFWYEFDINETHHIQVGMSQFQKRWYVGYNEKIEIRL